MNDFSITPDQMLRVISHIGTGDHGVRVDGRVGWLTFNVERGAVKFEGSPVAEARLNIIWHPADGSEGTQFEFPLITRHYSPAGGDA